MSALTDVFTAIANAIRGKNGTSNTYTPTQMAQAITDISVADLNIAELSYNNNSSTKPFFISVDDAILVNSMRTTGQSSVQVIWEESIQSYMNSLYNNTLKPVYFYQGQYYTDSGHNNSISGIDNVATNGIHSREVFKPFYGNVSIDATITVSAQKRGNYYYYTWISSIRLSRTCTHSLTFTLKQQTDTTTVDYTVNANTSGGSWSRPSTTLYMAVAQIYFGNELLGEIPLEYPSSQTRTYTITTTDYN